MTAICLAGIIGLLLGIWISEHEWAAAPTLGIANIFYTIPAISLLGMLIPLFGIGNTTAVIALTLYGIMPMVRNTYAGMKGEQRNNQRGRRNGQHKASIDDEN